MASTESLSTSLQYEPVEREEDLEQPRRRLKWWVKPLFTAVGGLLLLALLPHAGGAGVVVRSLYRESAAGTLLFEGNKQPRFLKIRSGDCSDHGLIPIRDLGTCRTAGIMMGLEDTHVFRTSIVGTEELCYFFQADNSVPATLWMGTRDLFAGSFRMLCMSKETAAFTHRAALMQTPAILGAGAPMSWVGCFKSTARRPSPRRLNAPGAAQGHAPFLRLPLNRTTTRECAKLCLFKGYAMMFLQESSICECSTTVPGFDLLVPDSSCGRACEGEGALSPQRYCGGNGTQAVFRINASTSSEPTARTVLKGISYSPVPLKSRKEISSGQPFPDDDFMSPSTANLWGPNGRHDLRIMKMMGANTVRLYGNDPALDHSGFMDEAQAQDISIVAGISDYPYLQMRGNCVHTGFDCYSQVKDAYIQNLLKGFVRLREKRYHPALRSVILMNEPDLKILPSMSPNLFNRALVSALDAMLDAEKEVGIQGHLPNFTVTFSFGMCTRCGQWGTKPALGQMTSLRDAMKSPQLVGYKPRNDVWKAYQTRFENSVNTANTAESFNELFLKHYDRVMPEIPVFVGEYHSPLTKHEQQDLYDIMALAEDSSNSLAGVSFFEFQVRYDKGGDEMMFGMFGLGENSLSTISVGRDNKYDVWCLVPNLPPQIVPRCGKMERGVRYAIADGAWSYNLSEPIKSPELCCARCLETPYCRSWTWEANPMFPATGCTPAKCWLHGGLPVRRESAPGRGAVSGLPPVGSIPSLTTSGTAKQLSELLIPTHVTKAFHGPGLDYSSLCSASAVVRMHLTPAQTC